jgi:hypothetical protein
MRIITRHWAKIEARVLGLCQCSISILERCIEKGGTVGSIAGTPASGILKQIKTNLGLLIN